MKKLQSPESKYPSLPSLSKRSESAARVNFLSRVASNLENGRNGKKMEDGQDHGQIIKDTRGRLYGVILIVCQRLGFCRGWGNQERFNGAAIRITKNCTRIIERFVGIAGSCAATSKSLKETERNCAATSRAARATQRSRRIEKRSAAIEERSRAIDTHSGGITGNTVATDGNSTATDASCDAISTTRKQAIRLYFHRLLWPPPP